MTRPRSRRRLKKWHKSHDDIRFVRPELASKAFRRVVEGFLDHTVTLMQSRVLTTTESEEFNRSLEYHCKRKEQLVDKP